MLRRSGMQPRVLNHLAIAAWNRASPFSSKPGPPPSSSSSGPGHEGTKELKAPPRKKSISFSGQIKRARSARDAIGVIANIERQGYHPDVYHYSAIISKCAKEKLVKKALEFLAEMEEVGIPPNVVSYNSAISACEKGRQPDIALSLLAQMKEEGIQRTVVSYNSAISACEKGGLKYTDTALSLFTEMKKAGVSPNDVAYRAIIKACFDSKRYPEAMQLAREAAGLRFKDRPIRINVSTKKGHQMWDLHDHTEATACMLLADTLLAFVCSSKGGGAPSYQNIFVVTGKGLRTIESKDPVLREKVPAFLNDIAGLGTTAVKRNEGIFLIAAASLKKWVASGASEKFKGLFQNR